ncbi:CHAT domain-containing protein [Oscillatoriales cyanobacterium LEGE 11467]|uniref:CHAT domain-containing protein n=1 Tax=Zarconia navalis LEGE 11467 TaxID=1828826 RepID=A0A928Z9J3_9CYAN|nr:CHAT domain-containing protein [Zarconia navalis LEGE 11467]
MAGETRAEALRRAQLSFLHGDRGRDAPLYWAPYVLVGDWR